MKCLIMFIILILISFVISKEARNNLFPNLPFGDFKVYSRGIIRCGPINEHAVQLNLYLYKISTNASEIRGNITLKKPFDDSFKILINLAVKDSIGGWRDNFYSLRLTKPCTNGKDFFVGAASQYFQNMFGYIGNCPISPNVYVSKGLDLTSLVSKMNVPRHMFYGSYKSRLEVFEKNGKQASCLQLIIDVKRPWETAE